MKRNNKLFVFAMSDYFLYIIAALVLFTALARYLLPYYSYLFFLTILTPLAYFTGGIAILKTKVNRSYVFWVFIVFLIWTFFCVVMNEKRGESLIENQTELASIAVSVFVCFAAGYHVSKTNAGEFLRITASLTVISVSIADFIAIIMVMLNRYIQLPFGSQYGFGLLPGWQRLSALCHPNSVGMIGMICIVLSVFLIYQTKRKWLRCVWVATIITIYCAIALANARTSEAAVSLIFGLLTFQWLRTRMKVQNVFLRGVIILLATLIAIFGTFILNKAIVKGVNYVSLQNVQEDTTSETTNSAVETNESSETSLPIQAEIVDTPTVDRPISQDIDSLNGRTAIWAAAFEEMRKDPSILLFGTSPALAEQVISQYEEAQGRNLHNSFFQILFATGVIGLVISIGFLICVFILSLRVYLSRDPALGAARVLPIALASVIVLSSMESFLLLYPDMYFANVWFTLLSGFICGTAERLPGRLSFQISEFV